MLYVYLLSIISIVKLTSACFRSSVDISTWKLSDKSDDPDDNPVLYIYNADRWVLPRSPHDDVDISEDGFRTDDIYTYVSDSLPTDPRLRPSISNGHLGTVVHTSTVHVNGVYNGHGTTSHRAVVPSPADVGVRGVCTGERRGQRYKMDARRGVFVASLWYPNVTVTQKLYAHRTLTSLVVTEIHVNKATSHTATDRPLVVDLDVVTPDWTHSPDIDWESWSPLSDSPVFVSGRTKTPERPPQPPTPVSVVYDRVPSQLVLPPGYSRGVWTFLVSVHMSQKRAAQGYTRGRDSLLAGRLFPSHASAWSALWSTGTLEISGDLHLAKVTTSSLFYILASLPLEEDADWPYAGLSPNGLPWGAKGVDYLGHVFWDQETWMYPPILALHRPLGEILLSVRRRGAAAARDNARGHGYRGLQYPWEVAGSGAEVSPSWQCAHKEIHVSGDIAYAVLQYIWSGVRRNSSDVHSPSVTLPELEDLVLGVADFWISRLTYNRDTGEYEILDVMGPDEYHSGVNNSVYTNALAKICLEGAADILAARGESVQRWESVHRRQRYQYYADRMYVPLDVRRQYHPEYDGYTLGTQIKQADVVLLGYPLIYNMSPRQRLNDLMIYENVTNPLGPAMTWCIHTISWLDLGYPDRAYGNLRKTFNNVASDFMVWTEVVGKRGAPNFLTGQGGFLQAMIFGYGGVRIKRDWMEVNCKFPPNVTEMRLIGFDYAGYSFDFICKPKELFVHVSMVTVGSGQLWLVTMTTHYRLSDHQTLSLTPEKVRIGQDVALLSSNLGH